jgi:hypothetical protein
VSCLSLSVIAFLVDIVDEIMSCSELLFSLWCLRPGLPFTRRPFAISDEHRLALSCPVYPLTSPPRLRETSQLCLGDLSDLPTVRYLPRYLGRIFLHVSRATSSPRCTHPAPRGPTRNHIPRSSALCIRFFFFLNTDLNIPRGGFPHIYCLLP